MGCAVAPSDSDSTSLFCKGVKRTLIRPKGPFMELFFLAAANLHEAGCKWRPQPGGGPAPGCSLSCKGLLPLVMLNSLAGGNSKPSHLLKFFCSAWKGSELAPGSLLLGQIQPDLAYFEPRMRLFFFYGEGAGTWRIPRGLLNLLCQLQ